MALTSSQLDFLRTATDIIPRMNERDQTFVGSVITTIMRGHNMTSRQQDVIQNAINRVLNPAPKKTEALGEMSAVIALFDKAKQKLKHPVVTLQTDSGQRVDIAMAGEKSSMPGSLNITDGGSWGNNQWFGRIHRDGTWEQPRKELTALEAVRSILLQFAASPAETASRYGRITGRCCFCCKKLDDDRSLAVGYGKTCAANYGLPWGAKASTSATPVLPAYGSHISAVIEQEAASKAPSPHPRRALEF